MPTLVRFLILVCIVASLVGAAMVALVAFVHVTPRQMEQTIAPAKLK